MGLTMLIMDKNMILKPPMSSVNVNDLTRDINDAESISADRTYS